MNHDYFWLTEEQFRLLAALLPTDTLGKRRVDDRRVISGIGRRLRLMFSFPTNSDAAGVMTARRVG